MPVSANTARSDDQSIDGLLSSTKWTLTTITYYYPQTFDMYAPAASSSSAFQPNVATFKPFNSAMQTAVDKALTFYSDVANLTFVKKTNDSLNDQAILRYAFTSIDDPQWKGDTSNIGAASSPGESTLSGDAWFPTTIYNYGDWGVPGSTMFQNILHETGHAMGLKHPQDGGSFGPSPSSHNSNEYSVMAYNDFLSGGVPFGGTYLQSLMMDDIAALQYLYGANYTHNAGDTTYQWSPTTGQMTATENNVATISDKPVVNRIMMTVWDGGGVDTYDFSNYTTALKVDLQPGGWTTVGHIDPFPQRAEL